MCITLKITCIILHEKKNKVTSFNNYQKWVLSRKGSHINIRPHGIIIKRKINSVHDVRAGVNNYEGNATLESHQSSSLIIR